LTFIVAFSVTDRSVKLPSIAASFWKAMMAQGLARALLAAILLWPIAGCGLLQDFLAPPQEPASSPPPPDKVQEADVPPPSPAPVRKAQPARPARELDLQKVVGLDKEQTLALLGKPTAVREQSPSTVWNYRIAECTLDLFFYMDVSTSDFRVLTYDLKTSGRTADSRRACLTRLRAASHEP
jgi:hypothetical protein